MYFTAYSSTNLIYYTLIHITDYRTVYTEQPRYNKWCAVMNTNHTEALWEMKWYQNQNQKDSSSEIYLLELFD